jgi:hypothetical protein
LAKYDTATLEATKKIGQCLVYERIVQRRNERQGERERSVGVT